MRRSADRSELVPLADRLLVLGAVRLVMAVVVLFDNGPVAATALYVVTAAGAEAVRRLAKVRALALLNFMLLVDGLWIAVVLSRTGGSGSSLGFLLYLHVVAVTLLVSYRTGLKVAAWHSLLLFTAYFAALAEIVDTPVDSDRATLNAVALWLVALGTAAFSSVSERELRRGKAELRAHAELATELEETRDADEVASLLLAHAVRFFGFTRGAVVLCRDDGYEARSDVIVLARGEMQGVVRRTWDTRAPALVHALDDEDALLEAALPCGVNLVVVPMVAGGAPVGALVLERGGTYHTRIRGRVVSAVAKLAAHAALALRNAALLEEVGRLAHTDPLTGLANRRVLEDALTREIARSVRTGEPVSLVLFDIDHFKRVNDTLGHQQGDQVLRNVASALAEACRDADLLARYGGEEFAVLLPACAPREAYQVAQRLRAAAASAGVTVSAGVAALPSHASDADELLRKADDALYSAKRTGRDRTVRARARSSRHVRSRRTGAGRGRVRAASARPARRPA